MCSIYIQTPEPTCGLHCFTVLSYLIWHLVNQCESLGCPPNPPWKTPWCFFLHLHKFHQIPPMWARDRPDHKQPVFFLVKTHNLQTWGPFTGTPGFENRLLQVIQCCLILFFGQTHQYQMNIRQFCIPLHHGGWSFTHSFAGWIKSNTSERCAHPSHIVGYIPHKMAAMISPFGEIPMFDAWISNVSYQTRPKVLWQFSR